VSVRVLLADDQPLVREGFRRVLARTEDLEVVGEAADGRQAVDAARRLAPDVIVMDIRMPVCDGLEATQRILAADARVRILMLTTFDVDAEIGAALHLSPATVKTHVRSMLFKLSLRDRTQLVICAYESGFVRAGQS